MNQLICAHCGAEFQCARKKTYCSSLCRNRFAHGVKDEAVHRLEYVRSLAADGFKECTRCGETKPLDLFKPLHRGVIGRQPKCKTCVNEYKRRRRTELGGTPRGTIAERAAARKQAAKQARRRMVWRRLWLATGETCQQRYARKYREDPAFQLSEKMRRQIRKAAKRDGVGELIRLALRRDGNSSTVERLLGYSMAELKAHLERQFVKGMSWDALNRGEIHIDHVIPQRAFNLSSDDDWRACWSLSNLQPLWAKDNLRKGAAITRLI